MSVMFLPRCDETSKTGTASSNKTASSAETGSSLRPATPSFFTHATVPASPPAWYGSVMGSSILATLSRLRPDVAPFADTLAVGFYLVAAALLIGLSVAFAVRCLRDRRAFTATIDGPVVTAPWGMVSMGILAFGAASLAVLPALSPGLQSVAWHLDLVLWFPGTGIGLVTAASVPAMLLTRAPETPTTVWGLAVVPPMVSATVGAGLVPGMASASTRVWMLITCAGCFFVALGLGAILFAIAYRHHWLIEPLPVAASITAWLPLGVVGQSTAAAQAIAHGTSPLLSAEGAQAAHHVANVYGIAMLTLGAPLVLWALAMSVRGFVRRLPFSPGWWGMTFPVGTLVLGAAMLGRSGGPSFFVGVGGALLLLLMTTWTICAASSVTAVARHRRRPR